jgi:hypothetical protein
VSGRLGCSWTFTGQLECITHASRISDFLLSSGMCEGCNLGISTIAVS